MREKVDFVERQRSGQRFLVSIYIIEHSYKKKKKKTKREETLSLLAMAIGSM